ncbi:MAG: glucose 1-dehydrogenase [Acidobacteria bacterium]|nr:glucose 1-dehydrogenase [Acidobacteriota bacterium]
MAKDPFRLDGKVALVTGAATGLGAAIAIGLAEAGADLALVTRSTPLDETVAEIERTGVRALAVTADLAVAAQREAVVNACLARFGRLDILVNNAGITARHNAEEFPLEDWTAVLETNATAVFHLCQLAGRHMLERGSGKIINIASLLSFSGGIRAVSYAASKGAVAQMTKALANEWASRGVNVNAVAPGFFRTRMNEPLLSDPARTAQLLARIPAGRFGEPPELKGSVVFLASAASDYVHGHLLLVDGGWMGR